MGSKLMEAYEKAWEAEYRASNDIRVEKLKLLGSIAVNASNSVAKDGVINHRDFNKKWESAFIIPGVKDLGDEIFGKQESLSLADFKKRADAAIEKKVLKLEKDFEPGRKAYIEARRKLAEFGDGVINDWVNGEPKAPTKSAERPKPTDIMGGGKLPKEAHGR